MKKLYVREIDHVMRNYLISGRSTPYLLHATSPVYPIVVMLIKLKLFKCTSNKGLCAYVEPTEKLLKIFNKQTKQRSLATIRTLKSA